MVENEDLTRVKRPTLKRTLKFLLHKMPSRLVRLIIIINPNLLSLCLFFNNNNNRQPTRNYEKLTKQQNFKMFIYLRKYFLVFLRNNNHRLIYFNQIIIIIIDKFVFILYGTKYKHKYKIQ